MKSTVSVFLIFLFCFGVLQAQTILPNGVTSGIATSGSPITVPSQYSSSNINYIRSWQPNKPITDANLISTGSAITDVEQMTQYLDGLGRPLQTVSKGITPGMNDMVAPVIYDEFGRESYKYLPYAASTNDGSFKTNPFGDQQTFMQSQYGSQGETFYYGKTEYEASPLNRVTKSLAAGNSWSGSERGLGMNYWINTATDDVKMWSVTDVSNDFGTYAITGAYDAGELYKNVTVDEHGKQVVEFKDKEGKVILKKVQLTSTADDGTGSGYTGWLSTYYIYDDLNNLRCVIQPKGVELISSNSWTLTDATILSEQCFRYEYDGKHRMITKKVPAAAEVDMMYDPRDRLVYSQDGNMRNKNWWMTTLYDGLNRPISTGITLYTGTRADLQAYTDDPTNLSGGNTIVVPGSDYSTDMVIGSREIGRINYQAGNSITFNPGFESEAGATFIAEIVSGSSSSTTTTIAGSPIPSGGSFTPLTLHYYDDYTFTQKTYDNSNNSKLDAGNNPFPEDLPSSASLMTRSLGTGNKVWVLQDPNDLSNGKWLETVSYYDDKGRSVQLQSDNYKDGYDRVTTRYDFTNKIICNYQLHINPSSSSGLIRIRSVMDYDHAGRLLTITKELNDGQTIGSYDGPFEKVIVQNEYDELGQLKNKKLGTDPNTQLPLETLAYDYNIRGWLKGINKDYVNNVSNTNYFGQTLSYDYGFNVPPPDGGAGGGYYNGNIAGLQWRSKGDGEQRAYGFDYDAANRILKADFTQNNSGWNTNAGVDFSVSNLSYDANGNIATMNQMGLKLNASSLIDQLSYTYQSNSNKLQQVTDAVNDNTSTLGDFKYDGLTKTSADYDYDVNGNMITDRNKNIIPASGNAGGITYNHLNLPSIINVNNKGTITYLYDAVGNKLQKTTVDNSTTGKTITTTTSYIDGYVYESKTTSPADPNNPDYSDVLQFIGMEEGRMRIKNVQVVVGINPCDPIPGDPNSCSGDQNVYGSQPILVMDYFIKDHLGNVRMVLTDEQKQDIYPAATLEDSKVATEQSYYDINTGQIADKSQATGIPDYQNNNGIANPPPNATFDNANSAKLYKLNSNTQKTGLGIALKVMSGDKIDIFGKSYYTQANTGGTSANSNLVALDIITALLGSPTGVAANEGSATQILSNTTGTANPLGNFLTNNTPATSTTPKAFINYILLDEQFKYVAAGASPVYPTANTLKDHHSELQGIPVTKNGYLYVYCSNESPVDVFFDNLQVVHTRGPILEETHYYPFGLTMVGISSKAAGGMENKRKFNAGSELQNKEFSDGSGLELYETPLRSLDPQLGRWWQVDPKSDSLYGLTPYSSMVNNPIELNDPNGDIVQFDKNASGNFKLDFIIAAVDLLIHGVGSDLIQLAGSKQTYTFSEINGTTNSFTPNSLGNGGTIKWNPNLAKVTTINAILSPTTLLNHEIDHAAEYDRDPSKYIKDAKNTNVGAYDNAEDMRVITGMERKTAAALGEIKPGHATRYDHTFKSYINVTWPVSTSGTPYVRGTLPTINVTIKRKISKSN